MSISGITNRPITPVTDSQDRGPSETVVQTTTVSTDHGALIGPATSGAGEIPQPGNDFDAKTRQLEQLHALREQLLPLAASDAQAAQLIREIDRVLPLLEQEIEQLQGDTDSDGISDYSDPDADGDLLTNEREVREGTNPYSSDTDGDGLSDDNEIRLRNLGRATGSRELEIRGNPLQADADHDGILDSAQLADEVRVQLGIAPAGVASQSSGATGVNSQSGAEQAPELGAPPSTATTLDLTPGGTDREIPEGEGSTVIRAPAQGSVHVTRQGDSLRINFSSPQGTQDILVRDFESKKLYFFGDAEVSFINFDPADYRTGTSGIYVADGSDSWAQGTMTVHNVLSPFDGATPESDRRVNRVRQLTFNMESVSDKTFHMLDTIDGQEASQWRITEGEDSDDLLLEAKGRNGETLMRFLLKNGNTESIRSQIEFQLADGGQMVRSSVSVSIKGGRGDDMITTVGGEGSRIQGGDGSDMVIVNDGGDGTYVDGGAGNDIIQGGSGAERLEGGEGNDYIYGGLGDNTLNGGEGNDAIFTGNTSLDSGNREIISGGSGLDISNAYRGDLSGIENGIDDLNGLQTYLSRYSAGGATPTELAEILRTEENDIPAAQALISENLHALAMQYFVQKEAEKRGDYGPQPGDDSFRVTPENRDGTLTENAGQRATYEETDDDGDLINDLFTA